MIFYYSGESTNKISSETDLYLHVVFLTSTLLLLLLWKLISFCQSIIGDSDCDLTCRAARYGFYNTFPEHAQNGALCNKDQTAVCLEGICTVSLNHHRNF